MKEGDTTQRMDCGQQVTRKGGINAGVVSEKDISSLKESDSRKESIAEILQQQLDLVECKVSYWQLYRYASTGDFVVLAISALCAITAGAMVPFFWVIFGNIAQLFQDVTLRQISQDSFSRELSARSLFLVVFGVGVFFATYISIVGYIFVGDRVTRKIREEYLRALMRQNIAFFETNGPGALTSKLSYDCGLIQDGISEKAAFTLSAIATLFSAFIIGFIKYWKLTLIASSVLFAIILLTSICSKFIVAFTSKSLGHYSSASTVAEEVLNSVRVAAAFGTRDKFSRRYEAHLKDGQYWGVRQQIVVALMMAFLMSVTFFSHSLTFYMGSRFITNGEATLGEVLTIALAILVGAFSLGHVSPHIGTFGDALSAAKKVYAIIDRHSPLDYSVEAGRSFEQVEGNIEFKNITHIYPSRPEQVVLDDLSLKIPAGKVTAIIGPSGSGKSTIISLIERFYPPVGGTVFLDGHDIKDLNIRWYRQQLSLVSQEPVLFGTTIYQNIAYGSIKPSDYDASVKARVEEAAKLSNAHGFIMALPDGYQTNVGMGGTKLSGGQKQRIAIARALMRNSKILLLDEATSALDGESEGLVQEALDRVCTGRTVIIVAHRLSTIRAADVVVVLANGRVAEQGSHEDLMSQKGLYYEMVDAQKIVDKKPTVVQPSKSLENQDPIPSPTEYKHFKEDHEPLPVSIANKSGTKRSTWILISLIASLNRPETRYMLVGLMFSVLAGGGHPALAIIFAKAIQNLSSPKTMYYEIRENGQYWALIMFLLGLAHLVNLSVQGISFAYCSEKLVTRARSQAFRTILQQDISFFDRDENSTGALAVVLANEAKNLSGASGSTLGTILLTVASLGAAIVISFAVGWKLALVCIATVPVELACGFYRVSMIESFEQTARNAYISSSSFASEAVSSLRTVASLGIERDITTAYHDQLVLQEKRNLLTTIKSSIPYAASQSCSFFCVALAFWYGGNRVGDGEYSIFQFFLCFAQIIFGAQEAGHVFAFSTDIAKAKKAATVLKGLLSNKPQIEREDGSSEYLEKGGIIEIQDVHFQYPTRPQPVLCGLTMTVQPGQYVALVGSSGSGKSTALALLERFYDPTSGKITFDGQDIRDLNVSEYRKRLSLVSQEPSLFQGTIRENILFATEEETVPEERIIQACKDANVYDFILSLPEGFSTMVGSKGMMLSGGQKQRLAIARALIRNPRILLLDEATSALDSESEQVVQKALDVASRGRTTVAIAHRLSTIQNADIIYVLHEGRVVEQVNPSSTILGVIGKCLSLLNWSLWGKLLENITSGLNFQDENHPQAQK
ncbi:ABC multidrug transporter Mdr1 [Arthroderma uncinatum]|uniref:ABC multidrug transporter Mdr1 n=1 Tax=Arthroderma uncinatum TaxID=74035 RepID=UPI00144A7440|nr:ABC multidrug transporter Mdr1 [Arthroderma uncinatum]KAF3482805.1 ABC multidrug transporter Mdr1 [Arthroderma uncinatum]